FVVLAAALVARWAAGASSSPTFHAEPEVEIVDVAAGGSGSGAIVLHNDTAGTIAVGSVTADPGCDAAFVHAPPGGFTLGPGAMRSLPVTCTPAPASMQRCGYHARSAGGVALLAFEAVC